MTPIKPVVVPTKGTGKYLALTALNFPMDPSSVTFYWALFTELTDGEGNVSPGSNILDGNITMDQEVYSQWGTDDNYAIDWALSELGFEKE